VTVGTPLQPATDAATDASANPPTTARRTPGRVVAGLLRGTRPKQWVKSVLVPAAPASAGVLFQPRELLLTVVAVVAFTTAAGGTYLVNDASDVVADRRHPTKRHRPVASGVVPVGLAWIVGIGLMAAAVGVGGLLAGWRLSVVLGIYVALTLAYSKRLKHVAIVELLIVAVGFVLRAVAGAAASGVAPSEWFLIVASFGSLFMVVGKRYAEVTGLEEGGVGSRRILSEYPLAWLRQVRDVSVAVTLLAYCLFAFERADVPGPASAVAGTLTVPWYQLSIVPVTLGLLRYALLLERGQGGAPEEVVLRDRTLLASGLAWAVLFGLGVWRV
jgi:decaprenyl-phosphate phosphoribosyltransferase